ncbi:DciA family protein [Elusimicrobiota bacterium]
MNWKPASDIISKIFKNKNIDIKDTIEKLWNSMDDIKDKADIVTLKNGDLILKAKNSVYLQELSFKKHDIIKIMNSKLNGRIKNIKLRLGG